MWLGKPYFAIFSSKEKLVCKFSILRVIVVKIFDTKVGGRVDE